MLLRTWGKYLVVSTISKCIPKLCSQHSTLMNAEEKFIHIRMCKHVQMNKKATTRHINRLFILINNLKIIQVPVRSRMAKYTVMYKQRNSTHHR